MTDRTIIVRKLGRVAYDAAWSAMRRFVDAHHAETPDEIWLLEHPPVYTLGISCGHRPYTQEGEIPVLATDRGGQITYHGPGQIVVYVLLDLKRRQLGVRQCVRQLEQGVIDLMAGYGIVAGRREGAPGVYVGGRKVAALGLRVRRGVCYHGLSLNVDMDLSPFDDIDPCGYPGLQVTQLVDLGVSVALAQVGDDLVGMLARRLGYRRIREAGPAVLTAMQARDKHAVQVAVEAP